MIRLETPSSEYEEQHLDLLKEFAENGEEIIPNALKMKDGETYHDYLQRTKDAREGKNLKPGYAPASLFFIVDETDKLVGGIHIRHELAGILAQHGGHIGYGIKPSERKKGYAVEALKIGLEEAKKLGINPVMLTCKKDNIGSVKTIINNGGELECEYIREDKLNQKWWIKND